MIFHFKSGMQSRIFYSPNIIPYVVAVSFLRPDLAAFQKALLNPESVAHSPRTDRLPTNGCRQFSTISAVQFSNPSAKGLRPGFRTKPDWPVHLSTTTQSTGALANERSWEQSCNPIQSIKIILKHFRRSENRR